MSSKRVLSAISMVCAIVYAVWRRGDAASFLALEFNLLWVMNAFGLLGEEHKKTYSPKQPRERE